MAAVITYLMMQEEKKRYRDGCYYGTEARKAGKQRLRGCRHGWRRRCEMRRLYAAGLQGNLAAKRMLEDEDVWNLLEEDEDIWKTQFTGIRAGAITVEARKKKETKVADALNQMLASIADDDDEDDEEDENGLVTQLRGILDEYSGGKLKGSLKSRLIKLHKSLPDDEAKERGRPKARSRSRSKSRSRSRPRSKSKQSSKETAGEQANPNGRGKGAKDKGKGKDKPEKAVAFEGGETTAQAKRELADSCWFKGDVITAERLLDAIEWGETIAARIAICKPEEAQLLQSVAASTTGATKLALVIDFGADKFRRRSRKD